jgi:hypothetical protein
VPSAKKAKAEPQKRVQNPAMSARQLGSVEAQIDEISKKLKEFISLEKSLQAEHNRLIKVYEARELKLEGVLLRIETQCEAALVREQERVTKTVQRINHTKIKASRIYRKYEQLYKKGRFDKGEVITHDLRQIFTMLFSEIQSTDRVVYPDIEKYGRLQNELASAHQRFAKMKKILSTEPKAIGVDPLLPQGISSLIIQRNELSKLLTRGPLQSSAKKLTTLQSRVKQHDKKLHDLKARAISLEKQIVTSTSKSQTAPQRVVMQWSDAEELARDYLIWLGHKGVRCTGAGADGGVDVESSSLVGQVKMHNKPTGRPEIQRLFGIAAAEKKHACFFAMAFSADAKAWAEKAGVALFQFRRDGSVLPIGSSTLARS